MAGVFAFLVFDDAGSVDGVVNTVDGGMIAARSFQQRAVVVEIGLVEIREFNEAVDVVDFDLPVLERQ